MVALITGFSRVFRTKPEVELERADTKRTNRSDSKHDLGANTIR